MLVSKQIKDDSPYLFWISQNKLNCALVKKISSYSLKGKKKQKTYVNSIHTDSKIKPKKNKMFSPNSRWSTSYYSVHLRYERVFVISERKKVEIILPFDKSVLYFNNFSSILRTVEKVRKFGVHYVQLERTYIITLTLLKSKRSLQIEC